MLSTVVSPHDGVVASTAVLPNTQVERGATLVRVRPEDVDEGAFALAFATVPPPATTVSAGPTADSESDLVEVYGSLRSYLLGYDLGSDAFSATVAEQKAFTAGVEAEDALIDLYVEIVSLYRPCTEADIWHEGDACPTSSSWQDFLVLKVGGVRVG